MRIVFLTTPELFAEHWPAAEPLLAPVVHEAARGEFTLDDLRRMTADGRVVTGVVHDEGRAVLALVLEFVHYPARTGVNVIALGGAQLGRSAGEFWPALKDWCKSAGAEFVEASCSDAMARLLGRLEFVPTYRVVRAAL